MLPRDLLSALTILTDIPNFLLQERVQTEMKADKELLQDLTKSRDEANQTVRCLCLTAVCILFCQSLAEG